ncbi:hypothetical protein J6590_044034 [Homalodisca vitripennis]|nr:hypothetical protein J6590_044034 [Homalodisca vitripennis]
MLRFNLRVVPSVVVPATAVLLPRVSVNAARLCLYCARTDRQGHFNYENSKLRASSSSSDVRDGVICELSSRILGCTCTRTETNAKTRFKENVNRRGAAGGGSTSMCGYPTAVTSLLVWVELHNCSCSSQLGSDESHITSSSVRSHPVPRETTRGFLCIKAESFLCRRAVVQYYQHTKRIMGGLVDVNLFY